MIPGCAASPTRVHFRRSDRGNFLCIGGREVAVARRCEPSVDFNHRRFAGEKNRSLILAEIFSMAASMAGVSMVICGAGVAAWRLGLA